MQNVFVINIQDAIICMTNVKNALLWTFNTGLDSIGKQMS